MALDDFGTGSPTVAPATESTSSNTGFNRNTVLYPSPFLDVTSFYIPKRIKNIFKFCYAITQSDGIISQCIEKMSEYPITKLIFDPDKESESESNATGELKDDDTRDFWKDLLEKKLKIYQVYKESGMNYYAYGNNLLSMGFPFNRILICPKCKTEMHAIKGSYKYKNFDFLAKCINKECTYNGAMKSIDRYVKDKNRIKIIVWDIAYIDIKYNSISGQHTYIYDIPKFIRSKIRSGDVDYVDDTPELFINAIKENKKIVLDHDNLFHMKRSAPQNLTPEDRGFGVPIVMPEMKDYFHFQILRKANEMICFDHIVPLRALFPQGTGDVSPHNQLNLGQWRGKLESEIEKWRQDPNYISIVPIPLGIIEFSGQGKILMTTPEQKVTEDRMIIGMGVIPEIIKGGASWSGSNVSLRIIENHFLNHGLGLVDLTEFVVEKISSYLGISPTKFKFADFKMADDIQKKQVLVNMASQDGPGKKVSDDSLLSEFGLDAQTEYNKMEKELKRKLSLHQDWALRQAEIEGKAGALSALYQKNAELENTLLDQNFQRESDRSMRKQSDEFKQGLMQQAAGEAKFINVPLNKLVNQWSAHLAMVGDANPNQQKIIMFKIKQAMPALFQVILENLKEMNALKFELHPEESSAFTSKMTQQVVPSGATTGAGGEPITAETPPTPGEETSPASIRPNPEQKAPKSGGIASNQPKSVQK